MRDIQHGISVASHMIPIAYQYNIPQCYIAANFSKKQSDAQYSALWPTINDPMRYGQGRFKVTLFELDRVERIALIRDYTNANPTMKGKIHLHVCWETATGKNCCRCEKCLKTLLGMKSLEMNVSDYGFFEYPNIYLNLKSKIQQGEIQGIIFQWLDVQESFKNNREKWENDPNFAWILDFDFDLQEKFNVFFTHKIKNLQHQLDQQEQTISKLYFLIKLRNRVPRFIKSIIRTFIGR